MSFVRTTRGSIPGGILKRIPDLTNAAQAILSNSGGRLIQLYAYNNNGSQVFLKFYDIATAGAVTVGTSDIKKTLPIPAAGALLLGADELAFIFSAGIQVAVVTGSADSNTTAPANNIIVETQYVQ